MKTFRRYKGLIIILDGLGDRSNSVFAGKTPLEAAHTPNLDRLLTEGTSGLVDPLIPGVPVGTHTGTGVLFGLAPREVYHLSRGPVEAVGIGMPSQPGDVFIRCNLATLDATPDGLMVVDRRAGRISERTDELTEALHNIPLDHGISSMLRPATQHRAVLRLSGSGLSAAVSDTDPGNVTEQGTRVLESQPLEPDDAASMRTADLLNKFIMEAYRRLKDHPVNRQRVAEGKLPATGILTRGAGMSLHVESIINHLAMRGAVITGERTVAGLGRLLNFTVFTDQRFTASPDTDLDAKVAATLDALATHDLVYLHIKGTDICSHDRNPHAKKAFLERLDSAISPLLKENFVIGVTADHSTDCNSGSHCGEPVPSILYAPRGRRDSNRKFGETECALGGLGRISANSFLLSVLDNMGYMHQYQPADWNYLDPGR